MTTAHANTHRDTYQDVTDRIIAALETGTAPWIKPWCADGSGDALPWNPASGTRYRGINVPLLWIAESLGGFGSSQWMTYKQAAERGGQVRRGERATHIIFWKRLDAGRKAGELEPEDADRPKFVLRTYCVFNLAQIDGIEPVRGADTARHQWAPHQRADAVLDASRADIRHGGDRAAFSPTLDYIVMPTREQFPDAGAYYSTALHELTHWTGHKTRLDRDLTGRFGSDRYAAEELVAELGAAYTCAALGVSGQLQHAEYISHWLRILRNDKRAIFTAASHAQRAADYLLAYDPAGHATDDQEAA